MKIMKRYIYNKVEKMLKGLVPLMLLAIVPSLTSCNDDDDCQSTRSSWKIPRLKMATTTVR